MSKNQDPKGLIFKLVIDASTASHIAEKARSSFDKAKNTFEEADAFLLQVQRKAAEYPTESSLREIDQATKTREATLQNVRDADREGVKAIKQYREARGVLKVYLDDIGGRRSE